MYIFTEFSIEHWNKNNWCHILIGKFLEKGSLFHGVAVRHTSNFYRVHQSSERCIKNARLSNGNVTINTSLQ